MPSQWRHWIGPDQSGTLTPGKGEFQMTHRFTLVRLLLVVILINTVLITLFVIDITSGSKWLSQILPGNFGVGDQSGWGNYVFLSLLLLINAVLVLGTGLGLMIPTLLDRLAISPRRLKGILTNRAGVSGVACEAVVSAVREEQEAERQQLVASRWVFRIGVLFFLLAFPALCFSYAHADPNGVSLFANAETDAALPNGDVKLNDILTYTGDQALGAVALDAPEIYRIRFSPITHNINNPWMPTMAFLFRALLGLILITGLMAIFRGNVLRSYTARPEPAPVLDEAAVQAAE
jgi:hypothetical protein